MKQPYSFDPERRIWSRPNSTSLSYSDGDEIEGYLLAVLKNVEDVSCKSSELIAAIKDWPSEYHLSPARHNLLRFMNIDSTCHVLELGCGCGAITRYLGECGAQVTSVEGSLRRAEIAAERCRDLPNVQVYCDNLANFIMEDRFDFVTLIGVLEYAPCFVRNNDPVGHVLSLARNWLKEDGTLILAIENQLGLKYLNGCAEDHTGIPYFGINDLYGPETAITFGRYELEKNIRNARFNSPEFFYPFPDYKLPSIILSETGLIDKRLNISDLLIHNTGSDHLGMRHSAFAEDLAWRTIVKNHLLADLANSFLVLARPMVSPRTTKWLAKMFSRGRRHPCYQVESTIEIDSLSTLVVKKQKIFPMAQVTDEWLHHIVTDNIYLEGNLLIHKIHQAMAQEAGLDELASCFASWLRFLLANVKQNKDGAQILPGNFVDCIPANLIENPNGELHYFDAEWVSTEPIPLAWTVIRGITYSLIDCLENCSLKHITYRTFITKIVQPTGIQFMECDFLLANQYEAKMVTQCHLDPFRIPQFTDFIDEPLFLKFRLSSHVPELRKALAWHEAELARVKSTVSWRITSPLRVAWNLYLKIVGKKTRKSSTNAR